MDYLTAAVTLDGKTLMAYLPSARTISVDLNKLSGSGFRGWWFNPRDGASQPAGEYPAKRDQQFPPPGEGDWCLVIDDQGLDLPAPGE
jgi:hypothetical protein